MSITEFIRNQNRAPVSQWRPRKPIRFQVLDESDVIYYCTHQVLDESDVSYTVQHAVLDESDASYGVLL